jgi:glycosyltransferase involved in cell wall biosynthesis
VRIGFDVSQTGSAKAGCGYFADSLVRNLAKTDKKNEYVLYPTFGDFYWDSDSSTVCHIEQSNFHVGLKHDSFHTAQQFWRHPPVDLDEQLGSPDIVHVNSFFCPIRLRKPRLVYTFYDLGFLENPEWTTEQNRISCFNGVFNASLYADYIVAISDYSRGHFLETFPHFPAERISVVYPASRYSMAKPITQPTRLGFLRPGCFWLTVGTLEPRKNHLRLLKAYAKLKAQRSQTYPLVLAGGKGWLMDDLEQLLDELNLQQEVILLGYVADEALHWLYHNCYALVYPSLFEGFGLPVLEAMSCGSPVITSNCTSIPEIVGEAGLLVDPYQEEAIFRAMLSLSNGAVDRGQLKDMSLHRAAGFSWVNAAESVLEIYRNLLVMPVKSPSR